MARRRSKFTQAEITRVLRAARQVGGFSVSISPDGTISLEPMAGALQPVAAKARPQMAGDSPVSRPPGAVSARTLWLACRMVELGKGRSPSQAQLEYQKAQAGYDELRRSIVLERRSLRQIGTKLPPIADHPKIAEALASLNAKLDVVIEEANAEWDRAASEYDRGDQRSAP